MFSSLDAISDRAARYKETISKKGLWPWIIGGLLAIALVVGIFFLKRRLAADQVALAKMRTKFEQDKADAVRKVELAKLELNSSKQLQLKADAVVAHNKAERELAAVAALENQNKEILKKLDEVDSWAELDNLNKLGR